MQKWQKMFSTSQFPAQSKDMMMKNDFSKSESHPQFLSKSLTVSDISFTQVSKAIFWHNTSLNIKKKKKSIREL